MGKEGDQCTTYWSGGDDGTQLRSGVCYVSGIWAPTRPRLDARWTRRIRHFHVTTPYVPVYSDGGCVGDGILKSKYLYECGFWL